MFSLPPNAATRAGAFRWYLSLLRLQSRLHDPAFQIQCFNQHAEDGVVNNGITEPTIGNSHSLLLLPDRTMKSTDRARTTYRHASPEEYRLGMQACQNRVDDVQDRRNEHEGDSIGSVIPVRNEVSAAEIIIRPLSRGFLV